ncbi:MAG TPA: helix-turn-helix domain-containing protein [Acidimicrobiales bacterium]|nr:helix-turn-helix domain-containing protein [Acidimicrobiales bacterium]
MDRLAVYKALGDDTRYALYTELVSSRVPLSTSDLARRLGLHANTVRPHLERMREAGLLEVETTSSGSVGRPRHRYAPAPGAPGVDLDPPAYHQLAALLAELVCEPGGTTEESISEAARAVGRREGTRMAAASPKSGPRTGASRSATSRRARPACVEALRAAMERLGFEPSLEAMGGPGRVEMLFAHCPFRELAEAHPEVVCHLHRGIAEGVVELAGGEVSEFATLADSRPCRAELALR